MLNNLEKSRNLVNCISELVLIDFIKSNCSNVTDEQLKKIMQTQEFIDAVTLKIQQLKSLSTNLYS